MLIIEAVNLTGLADNKPCRYEVVVKINRFPIWKGEVAGHMRRRGWPALLRRIAAAGERSKALEARKGAHG